MLKTCFIPFIHRSRKEASSSIQLAMSQTAVLGFTLTQRGIHNEVKDYLPTENPDRKTEISLLIMGADNETCLIFCIILNGPLQKLNHWFVLQKLMFVSWPDWKKHSYLLCVEQLNPRITTFLLTTISTS